MDVTRITLTIPRPTLDQLAANLLGLAGLLALVAAVGGLTGNWWWSLLTAGGFAVALAVIASTHQQAAAAERSAAAEGKQLRPVPPEPRAAGRSAA